MAEHETVIAQRAQSAIYAQKSETLLLAGSGVSPRLLKFLKRVQALPRGKSYGITIWIPEDADSEPVWAILDLGRVENEHAG